MTTTARPTERTGLRTIRHFVNGSYIDGTGGRYGEVYDPSSGRVDARVVYAEAADVAAAVASAAAAFPEWSRTPAPARGRVLARYRELLEARADELARAVSREHGKVLADARAALGRGIEVVEFATGIAHLLKGDFSGGIATGIDAYTLREPLGVVAGITPFNFPEMVPLWMAPVALACGNTFVLKPSEKDPTASLMLAALFVEAGGPPGAFNCVVGDRACVDALVADPRVRAISFVGSTPVARYVYETAAKHGKRVQAMGGAKNHAVVMPDADLDAAADALIGAAYGSAGERCMAVSVVVAVGDPVADALVARLAARIANLRVGPSDDPAADMGPLVTREHRAKVKEYIDLGVSEGAALAVDGRTIAVAAAPDGYFLGATLFDRVTPDMRIYREEIFGPVLGIVRTQTFDEALAVVNGHPCGNGAAIFTRDGETAHAFTERIEAGMVGVNVAIPVPLGFCGFGGYKESAFGDLDQYGPDGVRFYTRTKKVTSRWPRGTRAPEFAMPTLR